MAPEMATATFLAQRKPLVRARPLVGSRIRRAARRGAALALPSSLSEVTVVLIFLSLRTSRIFLGLGLAHLLIAAAGGSLSAAHVFPKSSFGPTLCGLWETLEAWQPISVRMKRLCLWLWIAAVGVSRLGASDLHESAPLFTRINQPVSIPAEVTGHGIFVSVTINGQGPFRMLVDTGCTCTMISPEVAAAVEARGIDVEEGSVQAVNGFGDAISMPRVLLDSITLGGVQFEGVVAGVVPLEVQSKIDSRELDGLLGYTLFSDLFFALDYPNQKLVMSSEWPPNLAPVRAELAITERTEVPFVSVMVQGKDFEVMIDTGATDRLHLPPASVASLSWKTPPRPGLLIAVAGEIDREQVGRLSGELELGQLRQVEPVVDISDGTPSIGIGLLHSFCLVFDESEDKLLLCSAASGLVPSPGERSVGLSMIADPAGWRVVAIIPNSPAEEASIVNGDLVTKIEGKPAQSWTRDQIQNWIEAHDFMALTLSGAGGERDVNLRVWSLVP
jgi:predicted aspartyl protease